MNQDAFRNLIATPRPAGVSSQSRPASLLGTGLRKKVEPPTFKPRKVVKSKDTSGYRNRAEERRLGTTNEFSEVEAVLDNFVQNTVHEGDREALEEQRRFLGGDAKHTVLVKGLDFALLEQNKARQSQVQDDQDDDILEDVFREASTSASALPKKRTREELVQALKAKRAKTDTDTTVAIADHSLEKAKQAGKFRPIGAPPVEETKRKGKGKGRSGEDSGEVRKKKKKVDTSMAPPPIPAPAPLIPDIVTESVLANEQQLADDDMQASSSTLPQPSKPFVAPREEGEPDDTDIFADAGDYDGFDFGGDDEDEDEPRQRDKSQAVTPPIIPANQDWFKFAKSPDPEPEPEVEPMQATSPPKEITTPPHPVQEREVIEQVPTKLVPLASSALPSVRDFLELDKEAEKNEKKRAMKEKRKKGAFGETSGGSSKNQAKKLDDAAKLDRDFKKLASYMGKKAQ